MKDFTDAQEQAFQKVRDLLKEHFDHALLCIETETLDDNRATLIEFCGSKITCLGLASLASHRLKRGAFVEISRDGKETHDDDDDED
jgi:hypothetical protein